MQENWYSIDDYARLHNISISTIRRRIKSNSIEYKMTEGKYYLKSNIVQESADLTAFSKIKELSEEIRSLKEMLVQVTKENDDLRTLITFYENNPLTKNEELELERFW